MADPDDPLGWLATLERKIPGHVRETAAREISALRLVIGYTLLDLEATRREREYLRQMLIDEMGDESEDL